MVIKTLIAFLPALFFAPASNGGEVDSWLFEDGIYASNGPVCVTARFFTTESEQTNASDPLCIVRGHVVRAESAILHRSGAVTLHQVGQRAHME